MGRWSGLLLKICLNALPNHTSLSVTNIQEQDTVALRALSKGMVASYSILIDGVSHDATNHVAVHIIENCQQQHSLPSTCLFFASTLLIFLPRCG